MSFGNLLEVSYWFSIHTPAFRQVSFIVALVVLIFGFALAVALRVLSKKRRSNPPFAKALARIARPLFFFAITELMLVWFRQLGAAVLSARFWMLLTFLIAVVWFAAVFRSIRRRYDQEAQRLEEERKYKEYLPRRRK